MRISLSAFTVGLLSLTLIASSLCFSACKSTKRKGCGCGADLNRMYKPPRR